jgi:hypothetical protein
MITDLVVSTDSCGFIVTIQPFTTDDFASAVTLNGIATLSTSRGNTVVPFSIVLNPVEEEEWVVVVQTVIALAVGAVFLAVCALVVGYIVWPEETEHFLNTGNFDYIPEDKTIPENKTDPKVKSTAMAAWDSSPELEGLFTASAVYLTQLLQDVELTGME